MEQSATEERSATCHRCLEKVPSKAVRCPKCGVPLKRSANIRVILGVVGILLFLAIAAVSYHLMQSPAPSRQDADQSQSHNQPQPPPPDKKPALGQ